MKRTKKSVLLAGLIAVSSLVAVAPPASGDVGPLAYEDCGTGNTCGWVHSHFTGSRFQRGSIGEWNLDSTFKNEISSVANRHASRYTNWFFGKDSSGTAWCLSPNHYNNNLAGYAHNDNFESVQFSTISAC